MKVLIVGSGGREHALAWKLAQECEVIVSPGNPGTAQVGRNVPGAAIHDYLIRDYLQIAQRENVDLTVVGPEVPLAEGVVDLFRQNRLRIVGPTQAAARLESSKSFSKQFMIRAGIPTAQFRTANSLEEAQEALSHFDLPVVLKADGLAAGKGVVIATTAVEAKAALPALLASGQVVIEEFLEGEEVSFIALSDGATVLALEPTQDHKRIGDGDTGPNTGGMGAYCDGRILAPNDMQAILDKVIQPAVARMRGEHNPFTGFLYAGLMMTAAGPKVLEFNARLGDPETQALMHRLDTGWLDALVAAAEGNLTGHRLTWKADPSICVVLASEGYPGPIRTGDPITGIPEAEAAGAVVFHAGTADHGRELRTKGGRVLGVTASGDDLPGAIEQTYTALKPIRFAGMQYRRDIGAKGLKRYNNEEPGT